MIIYLASEGIHIDRNLWITQERDDFIKRIKTMRSSHKVQLKNKEVSFISDNYIIIIKV